MALIKTFEGLLIRHRQRMWNPKCVLLGHFYYFTVIVNLNLLSFQSFRLNELELRPPAYHHSVDQGYGVSSSSSLDDGCM